MTLSLPMTFLLTKTALNEGNPYGGLEDGLEGTTNTEGFRVERIPFSECDLRCVSFVNNTLITKSTGGNGEQCKIEPPKSFKITTKNHQELS